MGMNPDGTGLAMHPLGVMWAIQQHSPASLFLWQTTIASNQLKVRMSSFPYMSRLIDGIIFVNICYKNSVSQLQFRHLEVFSPAGVAACILFSLLSVLLLFSFSPRTPAVGLLTRLRRFPVYESSSLSLSLTLH